MKKGMVELQCRLPQLKETVETLITFYDFVKHHLPSIFGLVKPHSGIRKKKTNWIRKIFTTKIRFVSL